MNLTYGVIAVVGVLIAISLSLIVADPNETPESRELAIPENNIAQIEEELNQISVNPSLLTSTSNVCLLYTSPSPRDQRGSRMPSSA